MANKDIRDAFFDEVYEIASKDKNVIFISADADAFSLRRYKKELPEQFINVGVAEQNMVLLATGFAMAGKRVFIYSITPFITMRCYEQLKVNVCSMNLNVVIVGTGSGFSFSYDGPTHHATQDIAVMRTLPEVKILNPCDEVTAQQAAKIAYTNTGPTFVRIDKGAFNKLYNVTDCTNGIKQMSQSSTTKIISTGFMTHKALEYKKELANKNVEVDVVDVYQIKPVPERELLSVMSEATHIYTLEENTPSGGVGTIVSELAVDNHQYVECKITRLSLEDSQVLDFGDREWLIETNGLNKNKILDIISKEKTI